LADPVVRTLKVKDKLATSRELFVIKPREPGDLPEQTVEIPSPSSPLPQTPGQLNMLSMILPPVIMMVASGALIAFMAGSGAPSGTWVFYLIMPLMGMGMPLASFISHKNQEKKYAEAIQVREQNYREKLRETRSVLDELTSRQREVLGRDYPLLARLKKIVLDRSHQKRLWWRRMADPDFLSLRMGTGNDHPSFSITPPRMMSPDDPLSQLAQETLEAYKEIPQLPVLLDLKMVGSVGLGDRNGNMVYGFARKLVLDVIVHHSPQDAQLVVLGDTHEAQEHWEWLKWTPHTRAIYQGESIRRLTFDADVADKTIEWLVKEFDNRTRNESVIRRKASRSSIVVLLDDSGAIRRSREIGHLAESGKSAGIYLVFIGKKDLPKECRAKIDLSEDGFNYMEMFAGERGGAKKHGEVETASMVDCERIARTLAGLEILAGEAASALPETVRLFDILEPGGQVSFETIKHNWMATRRDDELLQIPFGLQKRQKGLEPVLLNLLPPRPEYPGIGAYNTILIGFVGSGKSEFMKSLVLSAAYKYSPRLLNFFLMDFKGGIAFDVFKALPHVVGVVTNKNPLLVERALTSIEVEFNRRTDEFTNLSVNNIWEYNEKFFNNPLPHLLLILDEFSVGMRDFPALPQFLENVARRGRAYGLYLFLANQNVVTTFDRLLDHVGWKIALKLADQKEMDFIDRTKPKAERTGQGYLRSLHDEIYEFQAAYAGFSIADPGEIVEDTFHIYQVEVDGRWQPMYSNARRPSSGGFEIRRPKEQDFLISAMKELSSEVEAAPRIYLEPLEPDLSLEEVLQDSEIQRIFMAGEWSLSKSDKGRLVAPIGYTDSIEERVQAPLQIDFEDQDGHLWLIGAAASGKAMTIETTLLSLVLTNTPEDAWFYLIDFGAMGRLQHLSSLPHCGAYITPKDSAEMLDRLLRFLDHEMERWVDKGRRRDIFLVINNFAEFRTQYPDHVERILPYINNGKAAGIHLIISTNRRADLLNKMAIARRIVMRLTNRDEYSDAVGNRVSVLPVLHAEGRGLWVDGKPLECQVARARIALEDNGELAGPEYACEVLRNTWHGSLPPQIQTLSARIPLTELLGQIDKSNPNEMPIPVGVSFDTMQLIVVNLLRELPRWFVLGPPRSGKSNFLNSIAESVHRTAPDLWDVRYVSLRSPHRGMRDGNIRCAFSVAEAAQMVDELLSSFDASSKPEKKLVLLLDDLGSFFEPGRETLAPGIILH